MYFGRYGKPPAMEEEMGEETFMVWVTKYALTQGIIKKEVRHGSVDGNYVYTTGQWTQQFVLGKNAFHTEEEAKTAAREMRDKKIKSAQKQLQKLKGIEF
jgi:hypothetical protein